jgi:hypothetical protein
VPATVQAVIAARIDLLPALDEEALQAASVSAGGRFWEGAVREAGRARHAELRAARKDATSSASAAPIVTGA